MEQTEILRASTGVNFGLLCKAHPSTKPWGSKTTKMPIISIPLSRNSGSISENADDRFVHIPSSERTHQFRWTAAEITDRLLSKIMTMLIRWLDFFGGSRSIFSTSTISSEIHGSQISFYKYRIWLLIEWAPLSRMFTSRELSIFASR